MSGLLELPTGQNSLMVAYEAVEEGVAFTDLKQVVAIYESHFVSQAPSKGEKSAKVFERFSLVDPNIRTVVRCSTAA